MMRNVDWIGWLATAVFLVSYFTGQPQSLRRVLGAREVYGFSGDLNAARHFSGPSAVEGEGCFNAACSK